MSEQRTILLLFLSAIVVRGVIHFIFADDLIIGSDQIDYINLGRRLAAGDPAGLLNTYWPPLLPVLIGFVSLFIDGLVLPAIVLAVVVGSLVVPLTYLLVRQSYDHVTALIAAVLAIFYPHLLNAVFRAGSENVYVVLITASLITGWKAVTGDGIRYAIYTGLLLGLAYLTRPEAFAYPLFFMALIVIKGWWRKSPVKSSVLRVSALLLGFLLFATPYLVYLRAETGRWTISSKTEINTVMSDYPELADPGPDGGGSEPTFSRESLSVITRLIGSNLIQINRALPYLIPMPLLIFIALGLFSVGWGPDRLKWETYLISFCVLTVIGYALAVVQTRYFLVLLPIAFGWSARGILAFGGWLHQTAQKLNATKLASFAGSGYLPVSCVVGLLLCLLPLNFFITSREAAWRDRPYEERAAGTWLRNNGPEKAKVFSARKIPAFYADAVQVTPTTTDLEKVIEEIRGGGVEYVVTGKRELKRSPFLEDLEARMQAAAEFERVYSNTEHPDYNISIFRRK